MLRARINTLLIFLPIFFMFSNTLACRSGNDNIEQKPPAKEKQKQHIQPVTSPWGIENKGLMIRVTIPSNIEQGMPLNVKTEIKCVPEKLGPNVKYLNTFLFPNRLRLTLEGPEADSPLTITPCDASHGMICHEGNRSLVLLQKEEILKYDASFPLAVFREKLKPGTYDCTVSFKYSLPPKECTTWKNKDLHRAETWSGCITSGSFQLKVEREIPRVRTFQLPMKLSIRDGEIFFLKEDAMAVELPVRNGFFLGTKIYRNNSDNLSALMSGTPQPGNVNSLGRISGRNKVKLVIFETSYRPEHLWHPGPSLGQYKVLWKKTFDLETINRKND